MALDQQSKQKHISLTIIHRMTKTKKILLIYEERKYNMQSVDCEHRAFQLCL